MRLSIRTRRARILLVVALVGLVAAGAIRREAIFSSIGHALVREETPVKADAIVVLAGAVPERELAAADLYRAGWAPRVVVTEDPEKPAYAELRRRGVMVEVEIERRLRFLRELGVPDSALVRLPGIVVTTADEAEAVAAWARASRARRLIVVTSKFHTRRAGYMYERALKGQGVSVVMRGAAHDGFDPDAWWRSRPTLLQGLVEWQKTIFYRLRYW